jgi:hypothetical protein
MNKAKKIKNYMIITGIVIGIILVVFMILNKYIFELDFIWSMLFCIAIILSWILLNIIGIKILLHK